jgi:protein SCO1/2
MNPRNVLIAAVALFAIVFGAWTSYRLASPPPAPRTATVLPAPDALPEFSLVDQDGNAVGRDLFVGQWDLVFFGFTHCPDICPATLQQLSLARARVLDEGNGTFPDIILISVDPERDTAEVLDEYVGHFGAGVKGVTGSLDELRKLTASLGIFFQKTGTENDNYRVDHSAVVIVINSNAELHALFSAPHDIDHFVQDIPLITNST